MKYVRGIVPPLIRLKPDKLRHLVDYLCDNNVGGLFVLGSTGEFEDVDRDERYQTVRTVVDQTSKRVPVLVGCTKNNLFETLYNIELARDLGADCAVIVPNYHEPKSDCVSCTNHIINIGIDFPIFLYNNPGLSEGASIPIDHVKRIFEFDAVEGIKDSSRDYDYFEKLLSSVPKDKVFMGDETLLERAFKDGAGGGVPTIANVIPHVCVRLFETKDPEERSAMQQEILRYRKMVYGRVEGYTVDDVLSGTKKAFDEILEKRKSF